MEFKYGKIYFIRIISGELTINLGLYSSGTTGRPKAITHRTGGMLVEQYKAIALHQNLKPGDHFFGIPQQVG